MLVRAPDTVVDVPNREVNGVVNLLASCDRDSHLVRSKDNRDKHCPMCRGVCRNDILSTGY